MSSQLLYVAQRSASLRQNPRRCRDECAPSGVRRTAYQSKVSIGERKPVHHALRVQPALPFRFENVAGDWLALCSMKELQGLLELAVHRNRSSPAPFRNALGKQDLFANCGIAAEDHFPLEPGDLARTQAGLEAQQDEDPVPLSVTTFRRVLQEQVHLCRQHNFRRLSLASLPVSTLVFGAALTFDGGFNGFLKAISADGRA
jgi:hypothetical protein